MTHETKHRRTDGRRGRFLTTVLIATATALTAATVATGLEAQAAPGPNPVTTTRVSTPEKALRFDVTVPGSVDEVWMAFTTTEGLSTWLWRDTRVELRPGGDWLALFGPSTGGGTIQSFVPKKEIVIAAMAPEQFPTVRATRTTAVFDFEAVGPKSTHVRLTQTGWKPGKEWDDAYEYLATGNAQLLAQLHQRFATGPLPWPKGD
jgi:uncharacterized protein YndB with AHSA1/START domain